LKRNFYPYLEGFRGIAVFLVLISHWIVIEYFPSFIFLKFGFLGVNFFFVLSGFLITEILLIEIHNKVPKKKIIKNFFAKRTLRIFPIFYLTIVLLAILDVGSSRASLPWSLTYTLNIGQNWFFTADKLFMHIWYLCVEEQFYLLLPFLLIFSRKKNYFKLLIFIILLSISFKILIYILSLNNADSLAHSNIIAASDALAVGGVLAYLKHFKNNRWQKISQISPNWLIVLLLSF
jgi:peptidoglycan/LPS O-acetylase OafA/YrhL